MSSVPLAHKSLKTDSCFIVLKKILYCPTFSPVQCLMESRATNCLGFTSKGHVLQQPLLCLPDTPQAAFLPKAQNLAISLCVTFFPCFYLHSQSTFISIRVHMWVWGSGGCWVFFSFFFSLIFCTFWSSTFWLKILLCDESKPSTLTLKDREQKEAAKTCGDSCFSFKSDKTAYAIQYQRPVNFSWKKQLIIEHLLWL